MPTHRVRIIRHEAVPKTGSFEVRFADGRASRYFYYDKSVNRNKALDVSFQEVVHSVLTEEAEVAEASDSKGESDCFNRV